MNTHMYSYMHITMHADTVICYQYMHDIAALLHIVVLPCLLLEKLDI